MLISTLQIITPYLYVWGGVTIAMLLFYFVVCPLFGIKVLDLDESGEEDAPRSTEAMCWDALLWPVALSVSAYWAIVRSNSSK